MRGKYKKNQGTSVYFTDVIKGTASSSSEWSEQKITTLALDFLLSKMCHLTQRGFTILFYFVLTGCPYRTQ